MPAPSEPEGTPAPRIPRLEKRETWATHGSDLCAPDRGHPPATLIGRLARSLDWKGQGVGELLLVDALRRVLESTRAVASVAVVVDAKDDKARAFYKKYGFMELPDHLNRLFLPMKTIEEMFRV